MKRETKMAWPAHKSWRRHSSSSDTPTRPFHRMQTTERRKGSRDMYLTGGSTSSFKSGPMTDASSRISEDESILSGELGDTEDYPKPKVEHRKKSLRVRSAKSLSFGNSDEEEEEHRTKPFRCHSAKAMAVANAKEEEEHRTKSLRCRSAKSVDFDSLSKNDNSPDHHFRISHKGRPIFVRANPEDGDCLQHKPGQLGRDHHFGVSCRRGPVSKVPRHSIDVNDLYGDYKSPVDPMDKDSTDSEEYETELERRFPSPLPLNYDATGRLRYLKACTKRDIPPCSPFLRQATESYVNLKHYGLGPKHMEVLVEAFRDNTYVTHLDLSFNKIEADGIRYFWKPLTENQHLTHIELSYCFLGKDEAAAKAIVKLIKSSSNIHYLNLSHNCFTSKDYPSFAEVLELPSRLYYLDLSDNEFSNLGMKVFNDAIVINMTLVELNFSRNPILSIGMGKLLKALEGNFKIAHVNLSHTGADFRNCGQILNLLKNTSTILTLDLRKNHLGVKEPGVIKIRKYVDNIEPDFNILM
ncbi:leucine-rich repeat-containing protein 74A-like [Littorina saxatilis]|uniref:leucine-rich repeat-containing protein 74A-like n=1 Tax=Littorina saxatilis TaxID=31220 RepID=UPI0038B5D4DD